MRFGTKVLVERGGNTRVLGTPGCKRKVRGTLIGAYGYERIVRLDEDDLLDCYGWSKKGDVGHWCDCVVSVDVDRQTGVI